MIFIWFFHRTESREFCMFAPIFLDEKYAKKETDRGCQLVT